jgi:hypothetical protein
VDSLAFIMALEGGETLSAEQVIDGFAELVESGMAWQLQGSYGRMAAAMIQSGWIDGEGNVLEYPDPDEI